MTDVQAAIQYNSRVVIRYLTSALDRFFSSMWKRQKDLTKDVKSFFGGQLSDPVNKFKRELKKVPKYSKENITKATLSIFDDIDANYPYFDFSNHLSNITQNIICVYSPIATNVCKPGNTVIIDKEMVLEFIWEALVAVAADIRQTADVYTLSFRIREMTLRSIYNNNIQNAIIDFVLRYENRLAGNTLIQKTFEAPTQTPVGYTDHDEHDLEQYGFDDNNQFNNKDETKFGFEPYHDQQGDRNYAPMRQKYFQ